MEIQSIGSQRCPNCGQEPKQARFVHKGGEWRPGIFAVCNFCGEIMIVDDSLQMIKCPEASLDSLKRTLPPAYATLLLMQRLARRAGYKA